MRLHLIPLALAATLVLTGCAGTATDPAAPTTSSTSAPSSPTATVPTVPVAAAFGPAAWTVTLPETSQQKTPLVTGSRVLALDGPAVRAVDPQGADAWTTPFEGFADEARVNDENGYPFLRLADPQTVAVVDAGKTAGDGLDKDRYTVKVTLLNIASGAVVKTVTIPGTPTDNPKPDHIGLAFTNPDDTLSAVLPDGEVRQIPASTTVKGKAVKTDGGATAGSNVLALWGADHQAGDSSTDPGFAGQGWTSTSIAPASTTIATVEAADADHLILGRWVTPATQAGEAPTAEVQVIDAATGKVLAAPGCAPTSPTAFVGSPNREHFVVGPMRLDVDGGDVTCVGGQKGQKTVNLTAVTDDGRAFGTAVAGGSEPALVHLAPDGQVATVPLPPGTGAPIGVMVGDVAVHWDPNEAVLTGNPIL